jgi:predicted metal-dependent peptidase
MDASQMKNALPSERTPISSDLKHEISLALEQYHRVFDVFWGMSDIFFANVRTAAVAFPPGGKSYMLIDPAFWARLTDSEKLFVIIHECLHVMLDHGIRHARYMHGANHRLVNIAQDIAINEIIISHFGFARNMLSNWRKYCWIATCFDDPSKILENQTFEYYLTKLIEQGGPAGDPELVDEHDDGGEGGFDDGNPDDMAQELAKELTWEELQALLKTLGPQGGRGAGLSPLSVVLQKQVPEKINFRFIVQRLKRNAKTKRANREVDTFMREHRRIPVELIIPGRNEVKPDPNKLITALFFDVSGSCMRHFEFFTRIRQAFEEEEKLFDIRTFKFDTSVEEIKPNMPIRIGGGTSFNIIETQCQKIRGETKRYPDLVVIVTDGMGDRVYPEWPARWVWLLTDDGIRSYIPRGSRQFPISSVVV